MVSFVIMNKVSIYYYSSSLLSFSLPLSISMLFIIIIISSLLLIKCFHLFFIHLIIYLIRMLPTEAKSAVF